MTNFFKSIISWLAFLGLIISAELTYVYMSANFGLAGNKSFCNINEVLDCDAVARTSYSHVLGVPLAVWGMLFYAVILLLNYLRFSKPDDIQRSENIQSFIYTLSFGAVMVSVVLSLITAFGIKKVCVLCVANYIINILLFFFIRGKASFTANIKNTFKQLYFALTNPMHFLLITAIFTVGIFSLYYANVNEVFVKDKTFYVPKTEMLNMNVFSGNVLGDADGKIVIEEYTDFECPFCSMANSDLYRLVNEFKGVKVIHRDFPLKKTCNPVLNGEGPHKNSCTAALYGMAAAKQNKSAYLGYLMFLNQQNLEEKRILKLARAAKLDINQLKKDANDPEALEELKENSEKAFSMGIKATPTFIIGIKKHEGIMKYEELKKLIISLGATPR